jgi:hypothetical protein
LKRITPCKESIAMVNPAYIPTEEEVLLEKRREAYHQKKMKEEEQRTKRCAQDKKRYINMPSEKNKARIEQVASNPELKRILPWEESIAMVNPAYIATEEEVGTSTLNMRGRKPISVGETKTLLHHRNEEFWKRQRNTVSKLLIFDVNWKI